MGKLRVASDLILLAQIENDASLRARLEALHAGDNVVLEVGGYVGR